MENENLAKNSSNLNENNAYKKLIQKLSRKSMTYRFKLNLIKPLENNNLSNNNNENIDNNNVIENEKNKKNNEVPKSNIIFISKRIGKRRATERKSNMFSNSLYKNSLKKTKIIDKEYVFDFLNKNPNTRKEKDIISVAKYLSSNYNYFINLKKNDSQLKVEKLTKILKLEEFAQGESIINFGELGQKFYIVLEGFVEIYKPIYESIFASKNEFIQILKYIKRKEKNEKKYLRIKRYNKERNIEIDEYENIDPDMDFMKVKSQYYIEKLENLGKYGEGFSFGEMALIKNCERNATIKSIGGPNGKAILVSMDKDSYNIAMKEFQEKKIAKDVENFLNTYPFISNFNKERILKIFNCMNRITLEKYDYLFHQNDFDDNLYFIINGNFSLSIRVCFSWVNDYIDYIFNMKDNIINYLYNKKPQKFSKLFETIEKYKEKKANSPMVFDKYNLWEKMEEKENENNIIGLKNDEEKLNNNKNIYKLHIKNIEYPILLGIEDSFEFKKKFYTIQCISDKAEIKSIKIIDFMKIIFNYPKDDLIYLLEIILERKKIITNQIIKAIKNLSNEILNKLELKYENLINAERITKKEKEIINLNDKKNQIVSLIKMKGYKNSIQEIFDVPIDFLENTNNYKSKSNQKYTKFPNSKNDFEDLINSKKSKFGSNFDKYKNNKNNLLILKKILRVHKINKNIKKYKKEELNLSSFYINKSTSDISILKPITDRKILNNTLNTNNESITINNSMNNILNKTHSIFKKIPINNKTFEIIRENPTSLPEKNSSYYKNKLIKQNKKLFYKKFHYSKSIKAFCKKPLSFINFYDNKIKSNTYRDFNLPLEKNSSFNILNNTSKNFFRTSKKLQNKFNNLSQIHINDKELNIINKEIEKNFLDSKNKINKNNTIYGYLDDNKDFYLCNNFSKKYDKIFKSKNQINNHNFPLTMGIMKKNLQNN